jgi:hypothetical protein
VDTLLSVLQERVVEGRTQIARPIAILVTKWDLIEPGPLTKASEARATAYLETVHPDLMAGLRTLCENLRIFPVSATGPLIVGQPPVPLRPTNLGEPIAWLVETAERVMLERALASVEQNRSRLFPRIPGDPQRRTYREVALERLNHFLGDLPFGPLAEEARGRIEEPRAIALRRLKQRTGIVAMIVFILTITAIGTHDYRVYRQTHDLLDEAASDPTRRREILARVNEVIDRPALTHPMGHAFFGWSALRRDREVYRNEFQEESFKALERASSSLTPDDEQTDRDLLEMIRKFQEDFSRSLRLAEVEGFRAGADKIVRNIEEYRQLTWIKEDERTYRTHLDDPGLANMLLRECETFLKAHPGSDQLATVQAVRADTQANVSTKNRAKNYEEFRHQQAQAAESPWRCC